MFFFFFNDTATTEIYTLSLHDALPISQPPDWGELAPLAEHPAVEWIRDRKSTRLNSSHMSSSYAVFCLKKKTTRQNRGRGLGGAADPGACRVRAARLGRAASVSFFFNGTPTTEIYTLSLHDALPI